ncbi:MAG: UDP-N-acetylmuramate dehydrogenase [Terracidiphilus sp.]
MEENKPLAPFTTFGIGGPARWFVEAHSEDEIVEATAWARDRGMPLFVLGGGSNLLVADSGFDGLVLKLGERWIASVKARDGSGQMIYGAAAGGDWDAFVERTVQDGCAGVECLAGIPGTVGGTPVQNVGAYGQEVASVICGVRAIDLEDLWTVDLSAAECDFGYRRSRFNTTDCGRYIVTRVDYRLTPGGAPTLVYPDLQRAIDETVPEGRQPTLAEVAVVVRQVRRSKGMLLVEGDPDCRSAGSFFKNPVVGAEAVRRIAESSGKEPQKFPAGAGPEDAGRVKVPAAWLIEQAGFAKGYRLGAAGISSRHTLAIINRGGASAADVLKLAGEISAAVEARFGIRLEMEPVMVGF